jgi:alkylhydroperoxidase family enzyme
MGVPKPIEKDKASEEVRGLYDAMFSNFGRVPNLFGVMAHFPSALKRFLPFYRAVMQKGRLPARLKELAYLKTASINACRY